jgi:hypothetical protein
VYLATPHQRVAPLRNPQAGFGIAKDITPLNRPLTLIMHIHPIAVELVMQRAKANDRITCSPHRYPCPSIAENIATFYDAYAFIMHQHPITLTMMYLAPADKGIT